MTADPETVPDGFVTVNLNERETTENQSATKHKEWDMRTYRSWLFFLTRGLGKFRRR